MSLKESWPTLNSVNSFAPKVVIALPHELASLLLERLGDKLHRGLPSFFYKRKPNTHTRSDPKVEEAFPSVLGESFTPLFVR